MPALRSCCGRATGTWMVTGTARPASRCAEAYAVGASRGCQPIGGRWRVSSAGGTSRPAGSAPAAAAGPHSSLRTEPARPGGNGLYDRFGELQRTHLPRPSEPGAGSEPAATGCHSRRRAGNCRCNTLGTSRARPGGRARSPVEGGAVNSDHGFIGLHEDSGLIMGRHNWHRGLPKPKEHNHPNSIL
jgi:hypothetical protein